MGSKVLFIGHDATRTGAPMVLLHLLRWLRTSSDIEAALLLGGSGPMHDAFNAVAPTLALDRIPEPSWPRLLRRASRSAFDRIAHDLRWAEVRRWVWRNGPPRLIYGNTITNGGILAHLPDLGCEACPVITHVHELAARIRSVVTAADLATTKRVTTHYVAVSGAVRRNLIDSVGIEPERISVIHEFIPSEVEVAPGARENIRRELGWPPDAFVVGGSGSPGWGKGVDLFVQLALQMIRRRQDAPLRFLWVGGDWNRGGTFEDMMQRDVSHARLQDRLRFIGTCSNPADYYAAFDVFMLTSREDSFPLVVLEAARLGNPTVCFLEAGGAVEFVEDDCGYCVPYLDVSAMADRALALYDSPDLRRTMGKRAAGKFRDRHSVDAAGPRVVDLVRRVALAPRDR